MIVYVPIQREDVGTTVKAIPSEQLIYISDRRCLRKTKDGYESDFWYNTDYFFKSAQAAWNYLMKKPVADEEYWCRFELWPYKNFNLTAREERIVKRDKDKH